MIQNIWKIYIRSKSCLFKKDCRGKFTPCTAHSGGRLTLREHSNSKDAQRPAMKRVVWMYYAYAMKRPENRKTATGGSARKKYGKMTRESSDEGQRNPPQFWAEPTRSTPDVAEHMGGQWQNDQKPSSRTFPDLVCLFSSGAYFMLVV